MLRIIALAVSAECGKDLGICLLFLSCSRSLYFVLKVKQSLLREIYGANAVLFEDQGEGKTGLLSISMCLIILLMELTLERSCFWVLVQYMLFAFAVKQDPSL